MAPMRTTRACQRPRSGAAACTARRWAYPTSPCRGPPPRPPCRTAAWPSPVARGPRPTCPRAQQRSVSGSPGGPGGRAAMFQYRLAVLHVRCISGCAGAQNVVLELAAVRNKILWRRGRLVRLRHSNCHRCPGFVGRSVLSNAVQRAAPAPPGRPTHIFDVAFVQASQHVVGRAHHAFSKRRRRVRRRFAVDDCGVWWHAPSGGEAPTTLLGVARNRTGRRTLNARLLSSSFRKRTVSVMIGGFGRGGPNGGTVSLVTTASLTHRTHRRSEGAHKITVREASTTGSAARASSGRGGRTGSRFGDPRPPYGQQ